jgi:hypothetical protein
MPNIQRQGVLVVVDPDDLERSCAIATCQMLSMSIGRNWLGRHKYTHGAECVGLFVEIGDVLDFTDLSKSSSSSPH